MADRSRAPYSFVWWILAVCVASWVVPVLAADQESPVVPVIGSSTEPPPGAVVLFDGTSLDNWITRDGRPAPWPIEDGAMCSRGGDIGCVETYTDALIHIEFRVPDMPNASGQGKGNSGIFINGRYELQVLDSFGFESPGKGDCGALYSAHAPLVNACTPPGQWQTFDIVFRAARRDDAGNKVENARFTVFQNGVLIHNNVELSGVLPGAIDDREGEPGPLFLQDHGCDVRYRNIWLVHLPAKGSDTYEPH